MKTKASTCEFDIYTLYVESICDNKEIIERNIISTKLKNPDYVTVDPQSAINDFYQRIQNYEKIYRRVEPWEGPYIKVIDVGNDIVGHSIQS